MSLYIKNIEIKNFRSIRNLSIEPSRLSILVGNNDTGKSNILRAINLFFNGTTMPNEAFDFDTDHNVHNDPNRKAKEISIKLEIVIPDSYVTKNGNYVVWEKRWRSGRRPIESIEGRRWGPRKGKIARDKVKITSRSNVRRLLDNIDFVYVPAIKDVEYFSFLRASIYNVIAAVADKEFRASSRSFEKAISEQLRDLTNQITESLGFQSRLAFPKDLSHVFERLDFLEEDQNISLEARGDGVKARHIPLILKFLADKKRDSGIGGGYPNNIIWGYEEPENNLEIVRCIELADQFLCFLKDGISQIFLTTHSPVIYNLKHRDDTNNSSISCHHIHRDSDIYGTQWAEPSEDLDKNMGVTAFIAPRIKELEDEIRKQGTFLEEAERSIKNNKKTLFVEGESDRLIFTKALQVFYPKEANEISVMTKKKDAGYNYVMDMLLAWRIFANQYKDSPKAAGLLDSDGECKKLKDEWNGERNNTNFAKCFILETPLIIKEARNAGFNVPASLEAIYDRASWEYAESNGYLEERDDYSVASSALHKKIVNGETDIDSLLRDDWRIFVKNEFLHDRKVPMARHFARKSDNEFRERFLSLNPLLSDIVNYLM